MIKRLSALVAACAAVSLLSACAGNTGAGPATPGAPANAGATQQIQSGATAANDFQRALASGHIAASCDAAAPGEARCFAYLLTNAGRSMLAAKTAQSLPSGYGPTNLQTAYNTTSAASTKGSGKTVAIVDAYDAPNLEADLGKYRSTYGLPPCTTANGCFKKVNQNGGASLPKTNASWAQETSLDVDMVSANCPNCKILVVEANSASFSNLATAVNTAASLGAVAVSNSYGGSDSSLDAVYASAYNHPDVAITVSAGDSGYGAQSPASYNTVTAVGGTSLKSISPLSETVWSGTGSGCSSYNAKPRWQHDLGCTYRMIADVAYDADPYTGVAVYDSLAYRGYSGWLVFGGTSVGAPSIAAIYALSGDTGGIPASLAYASHAPLNDITSGSNGSCSVAYFCHAEPGYDGPTGNGTPNGTGAF